MSRELEDPGIWNTPEKAQELGRERARLEDTVGTLDRLVQVDTASAYILSEVENIAGVQDLTLGPDGNLWVGTPSGLLVVDPKTKTVLRSVTPFRGRNVTVVRFDAANHLWVGTDNGLYWVNYYNGAIETEITELPSSHIFSVSPDTGNKVWVGTREGLVWVSLRTGKATVHEIFE